MKKRSHVFILSLLIATAWVVAGLITAAGAEEPQYGGILRMCNLGASLNPGTWDNADWHWKHGHDTGPVIEHLFMGNLQKGPRGTNEYPFTASAWIPPHVMRGELVESWEKEDNPLRLVFNLRKGVYWQEKPGVMQRREFTADDVVYSMNRLKNARRAIPTSQCFRYSRPSGNSGPKRATSCGNTRRIHSRSSGCRKSSRLQTLA